MDSTILKVFCNLTNSMILGFYDLPFISTKLHTLLFAVFKVVAISLVPADFLTETLGCYKMCLIDQYCMERGCLKRLCHAQRIFLISFL